MNQSLVFTILLLSTIMTLSACTEDDKPVDAKPEAPASTPEQVSTPPPLNPEQSALLEAAEHGDLDAQLALGKLYIVEGDHQHYGNASKWYHLAADQGSAQALFNIGVIHDKGYGVESDWEEAAKWYRKSAELGFPDALFNLGVMYEYGQAVPQDYAKAREYYLMAAEKGDPSAQFSMGLLYDKALGLEKDFVQAYMWWDIAGDGYIHAQHNRDSVAEDMTPEQISEAKQLADAWREAHADVEQLPAQEFLPGFE